MSSRPLAAVVMAAGQGTRMRSRIAKHLQPLLGRRLVDWAVGAALPLAPAPFVVVCSPETRADLEGSLPAGVEVAVQVQPLGTAAAVAAARELLDGRPRDLLVLSGDHPLLTSELLTALVEEHRRQQASVTVLSFEPADPRAYGRIIRGDDGRLVGIVEAADASPEELAIREVNSSIYVFAEEQLWDALDHLEPHNAQGELYLTDAVRLLAGSEAGAAVVWRAPHPEEVDGVNTRAELAAAAAVLRDRILAVHMDAGVGIVDPATTWIDAQVEIEADAVIHPFTVLRGRSRVGSEAEVGPHVVVVDAEIGRGATVGPFCYLRPGTRLLDGSRAGAFVEMKNAMVGPNAKVPHMSYIGDAEIGEGTNIGAGAITANYRAERYKEKQRTIIGRYVHTGSQNVFVPPVTIGDGAWTGAGSTITEDVPPGALAVARARQVNKEDYGAGERHKGVEHD
jgi:bifunctional UDP-N-acetylglucosamine pyrophosphorylase/glucosamine-1-phosphate N-acetyltransferase